MKFLVQSGIFLLGIFALTNGQTCTNPQVTVTSYTTQDATVLTNLAFIAEFTLKCGTKDLPLHAAVNGKILPVVRIHDGNKYQVSWIEDPTKAVKGDYTVKLYDDDGYSALRKAIRNNEDTSSIKPLTSIIVNFPGAYQGPWVNSEFMAALLSVFVCYLAFSAKSKLLA